MILRISQNSPQIYKYSNVREQKKQQNIHHKGTDYFVPAFGKTRDENPVLLSTFLKTSAKPEGVCSTNKFQSDQTTQYTQLLSEGIKREFNVNIPPKNLASIMTPKEFRDLLPSLSAKNFKFTKNNIKNGIYVADLNYTTKSQMGIDRDSSALEKASELANQYYAENGKPFIFAVTEKDDLKCIQEMIKTIGQNPEKYKNLKIVPALKLSFTHEAPKSQMDFENSEMLVYGIDPFDKDLINLVKSVKQNSEEMVLNFIKRVNRLYPEFSYDIYELYTKRGSEEYIDYSSVGDLYRKARRCAAKEPKNEVYVPEIIKKNANSILNMMRKISSKEPLRHYPSFFEEYSVNEENKEIFSVSETMFKKIIQCLNKQGDKDNKPVIALSAPYYLTKCFEEHNSETYDNVISFIEKLKKESEGLLCALETAVPSYNSDEKSDKKKIEEFNKLVCTQCNLHEVGGSFSVSNKPIY